MRVLAGRYRLRERIGAGGMGEMWRATDDVLGRTVAVKLILPALLDEPGFVRRFLAEARAMASVRHPGVIAIHDFHADGVGAYLVMEYADGEPVSKVLRRVGRLGAAPTMDLVRQAALALQAVHDRGIVHRDVKPANLLLRADGTLALTDFGIARGLESTSLTRSGAVIGAALPPGRHAAHRRVARHDDVLAAAPAARHDGFLAAAAVAPRRSRRGAIMAVAALVLAVLGGVTAGLAIWLSDPADAGDSATAPGKPVPNGFVACGDALCPTEPMCWRGLVQQGDNALPPARVDCTEPHYWETFTALRLPADAVTNYDLSHLMDRPDIASACSADAIAEHSSDPAQTPGWRREAWPIPADPYTVLVHCLGGSPDGESPGAVFRP